jgi:hypothetical protein
MGNTIMSSLNIAAVAAVLAAAASGAYAQSQFDLDFDEAIKPWQEIARQLPTSPKQEHLVPFSAGQTLTMLYAIDAKSLVITADGIIRYTLVAKSPSGAENISYEGMRCQTSEVKVYAYGQKDGTWSRSRRKKWERISDQAINRPQSTLFQDYFCNNLVIAKTTQEILEMMQGYRSIRPEK